ncbi:MAG: starch-binding protein [Clostridia bacterium]|nr:starch-binding protein [Clostridia bacterium]
MKKHRRLKALLSMILALLMVVSSFTALGIVSVSANSVNDGIYLRGSMNAWGTSEEYRFTDQGGNIYTLVKDIPAGTYNYKVATPQWNAVNIGADGGGDAVLALDSDAVVKFTLDLNTKKQSYVRLDEQADFTLGDKSLTIEAEKYTYAIGAVSVLSDSKASAGKYVGDFNEGDSINFGVSVSGTEAKAYRFTIDVASETDDGLLNFVSGDDSFSAYFLSTGGWQKYKSMVITKTLQPGYNRIGIENRMGTYNVDKIVVEPVTDYVDAISKGETTLDFSGYDSITDTATEKDGVLNLKAGDQASLIVKPEQDGVYVVSLGEGATVPEKKLLLGDADGDDKVNVKDATTIQKSAALLLTLSDDAKLCADVDSNENVNVKDATAIQKHVALMDTGYAIGEYFTVSGAAAASEDISDVSIGTEADFMQGLDDEHPTANLVIDGETEVFLYANNDVTIEKITFTYIPNVEEMGYWFSGEGYRGVRFESDFLVNQINITPFGDTESIDIMLSDGTKTTVTNFTEDETKEVKLTRDHNISWVRIENEFADFTNLEILGKKDETDKTSDIALEGYVSTTDGWQLAVDYPCDELTAKEFGIGFEREASVDKVSFVSFTDEIPETVTVTSASGETKTLKGTLYQNDTQYKCTFSLDGMISFGYFFEFSEEVTINMITAEGDTTYQGASTNVSGVQDYELFANGLTENDSRVIANTGTKILTSETGSDREWNLTEDTSDAPAFYAPNTPLAEAAYNLTMEEIFKSINYDETFGEVFYTGTNWQKVWTRDTAISMQYILSWLFPEISTNCAEAKVVGKDGNLTFEEDTGTGGSYPVSTDRIIMMLACWETYLADGNEENLEYFYEVASNTIEQDYEVVFDAEAGLFRGETCGLDHRDKTYGDWTGEDDENGIVTIAEGKATSTNIIYCQVMKILSEAATILGKGETESKAWADLAADLEEAISTRLWHEDLGTYASWEYPDWMGSPLSYKQDVLADGYAVWYNIGTEEQVNSIMDNHTLVNFGANTVYPQKNAARHIDYKYHDSGVWPGWEALLMIGAANNENENNLLAEEIWNSCVRGAASCLTNYEVIDYETGEGLHSTQQLWSIAGTMSGYYRVLFGMEYTTDGITFDPYIPDWMNGPFYIDNYKYRDAVLSLELYGDGDTVESIYVNGDKVANDYVFPTDAQGEYNIVINVTDSGAVDTVNLKPENTAKAPTAPTSVTLSGTTLSWSGGTTTNVDYKVWTGSEYVDVTGKSYEIDSTKYGCYSVVAVDKTTGLWSELAKPVTYSPAGSNVTVNVGSHTDNVSSPKALTINVTVPVDGVYQLSAIHTDTNNDDPTSALSAAIRSVYVDGEDVGTLVFPIANFGHQLSSHLRLELTAGTHEVTIKYDNANWYDRNMDQAHGGTKNGVTYHMIQFTLVDGNFSEIVPPEKKTVYFTNNNNWSKVNIYYWGGSDSAAWPGTAMTYVGKNEMNQDVYSFELDPSTPNILFNNGQNGDSNQTVDITTGVEDGTGYYIDTQVSAGGKWKVGSYTFNPDTIQ